MDIANSRLSPQVLTIEEAENLIRLVVKDEMFFKLTRIQADERVRVIIRAALSNISIPSLRDVAWRSLLQFHNNQRRIAHEISANRLFVFLALAYLKERKNNNLIKTFLYPFGNITNQVAKEIIERHYDEKNAKEILSFGNALDMHHERYMKDFVKPVIERMAREKALDPDAPGYIGRRMSLLARAELEVRYEYHQNQIQDFKARGVKLVVASSHSDCSDRCLPWQGRVYSLDGTYGLAPDGRRYVPLEIATNILTPNGKWYNGLLGFNCRHTMRAYNYGLSFPNVSPDVAKKQYSITQKQRAMERDIRRTKALMQMADGIDHEEFKRLKSRVENLYAVYKKYSRKNKRAYYPSRTKIL